MKFKTLLFSLILLIYLVNRNASGDMLPPDVITQFRHGGKVFALAYSLDGQWLASGGDDNTVRVWDISSESEIRYLDGHTDWIKSVAFSPDGKMLASAGMDGFVKLWDASGIKLTSRKQGDRVEAVAFSPDGEAFATSGHIDGFIDLWAVSGRNIRHVDRITEHRSLVSSVTFSPDSQLLASAGDDDTVRLWNVTDMSEISILTGHIKDVTSVAFSPNGDKLASGSRDNTVKFWEVSSGEELATLEHRGYVESIAFSPHGKMLAAASAEYHDASGYYTVKLWAVDSQEVLASLRGHQYGVTSVAFSPDGKTLASGGLDGTILVWDLAHFDPDSPSPVPPNLDADKIPKDPTMTTLPEKPLITSSEKPEVSVGEKQSPGVHQDTTPPHIVVIDLPPEKVVRIADEQLTIQGKVTDDTGVAVVTINDAAVPVSEDDSFEATLDDLTQGKNEIRITATDIRGNKDTFAFMVIRDPDTTGPEIRILSPKAIRERGLINPDAIDGDRPNPTIKSIDVDGEVTDPSGVAGVWVNGKAAEVTGDKFKATVRLVSEDQWIRVRATDTLGNESVKEILPNDPPPPLKRTDYALLFAVNAYAHWPELRYPFLDATAIQQDLQTLYGFQVELVKNPTEEDMREALFQYAKKTYTDADQLFIFFAGHGHFNETFKQGYFVLKDTKLPKDDVTMGSYLSHSEFRDIVDSISCKHILLALDTCYSGTFDKRIRTRGEANHLQEELTAEDIKRMLGYKTRRYLTSAGKEQVPDDSQFIRQLLAALRSKGGRDNILTIDEILSYLEKVDDPKPREGEFGSNEPGSDFLFFLNEIINSQKLEPY